MKKVDPAFRNGLYKHSAILLLLASLFSFVAACGGLLFDRVYNDAVLSGVLAVKLLPGTFSQDLVTVPVSAALFIISISFLKKPGLRLFSLMFGLGWCLFYSYAMFVITGNYTLLYPLYLAAFGASLFGLFVGSLSIDPARLKRFALPPFAAKASAVFLLFIVLLFTVLWSAMVVDSSLKNVRLDAYAVFIMDLCVVMPAFAAIAVMLLKNGRAAGFLSLIAMVKTSSLILSVSIGEFIAPSFGMQRNVPMFLVYAFLTLVSAGFAVYSFRKAGVK